MAIPERFACDHLHRFSGRHCFWMAELGGAPLPFQYFPGPEYSQKGEDRSITRGWLSIANWWISCSSYDITPHVTLFHWDSPQALETEYGSWRSRQMAQDLCRLCSDSCEAFGRSHIPLDYPERNFFVSPISDTELIKYPKWLLVRWSRPQRKSGKPLTMLCFSPWSGVSGDSCLFPPALFGCAGG